LLLGCASSKPGRIPSQLSFGVRRRSRPVKKLRWFLASLAVVACALFAAVQLGWLCPHPQHWLDGLLYVLHLETPPAEPPDFDSNDFKPEEPMDLIPYEPAVCEVHRTDMRAEIVPVHYGTPMSMFRDKDGNRLLAPGEIDPELRHSLFPHAAHSTWGGCVVSNRDSKTARIRICSNCERDEQKWRDEHPESK
jgi:hypothetical protein